MKRVLRAFVSQDNREPLRDQDKCDNLAPDITNKNFVVGRYNLSVEGVIGEGGFALVYLVKSQHGHKYALKRMFVNNEQDLIVCEREIEIMKNLISNSATNVVKLVDSSISLTQTGDKVYEVLILMELCTTQLFNIMKERLPHGFNEQEVMKIFCDVCKAVLAIHHCDPPVIIRDLKIENILRDEDGRYVVCDFGSATWDFESYNERAISPENDLPPAPPSRSSSLSSLLNNVTNNTNSSFVSGSKMPTTKHRRSVVGRTNTPVHDANLPKSSPSIANTDTNLKFKRRLAEPQTLAQIAEDIVRYTTPAYRAPELVDIYNNVPITVKSDIWALGCILYKLCFYTTPFGDSALAVQNATLTVPDDSEFSVSVHRLIRYMLEPDISLRPNIDEVAALAYKISGMQDDELGRMVADVQCPDLETLKIPMSESEYRQSLDRRTTASKFESIYKTTRDGANSPPTAGVTKTSVAPIERPRGLQVTSPSSIGSILPLASPPTSCIMVPRNAEAIQVEPNKEMVRAIKSHSQSQSVVSGDNEDLNFGEEFDRIRQCSGLNHHYSADG